MLDDILSLLDNAMGIAGDFSEGVNTLKKANADSAAALAGAIYSKKALAETGAAVEDYEAAAMTGDEGAQNRLVALYILDTGLRDYEKAAYWAQILADRGDADALAILHKLIFDMGVISSNPIQLAAAYYEGGDGSGRDIVKVKYWTQKAALNDPTVLEWSLD